MKSWRSYMGLFEEDEATLQRKADAMQAALMAPQAALLNNQLSVSAGLLSSPTYTNGTSSGMMWDPQRANGFQSAVSAATTWEPPALGVPLWKHAPLPDDWRGAQLDRFELSLVHEKWWRVTFRSKYSDDSVFAYLLLDEYSGNDAGAFAETLMTALNLRRQG